MIEVTKRYGLKWSEVFKEMQINKAQARLKTWAGFWSWNQVSEKDLTMTIMMHTKEGECIDIRNTDRPQYTFGNIGREDWVCVYPGDEDYNKMIIPQFDYETAKGYIERGIKITRLSDNGNRYMTIDENKVRVMYNAKTNIPIKQLNCTEIWDMVAAKDYTFYNETMTTMERDFIK